MISKNTFVKYVSLMWRGWIRRMLDLESEVKILFPLGATYCCWIFLFSHSKVSDAIIANFVYFVKSPLAC